MNEIEGDEIFYVDQNLAYNNQDNLEPHDISIKFKDFIKNWMVDNQFIYRNQLIANGELGDFFLKIQFKDIEQFEVKISTQIREKPMYILSILEKALRELYLDLTMIEDPDQVEEFQILLFSGETPKNLRQLKSDNIGKIIKIQGIVIQASSNELKGKKLIIECRFCGHKKQLHVGYGDTNLNLPQKCENSNQTSSGEKCPNNSYVLVDEESSFIDYQLLKVQETNESTPNGETPRTYRMFVERYLVDKLVPGNQVSVTAIYTLKETQYIKSTGTTNKSKIPYLFVLGYENLTGEGRDFNTNFTPSEEQRFIQMSKDPQIFENIHQSIASSIFGNENIKKAIACLLFSGSSKLLSDNTKLRGDINVLLIGDPSTAKSQFLKFVHKVAPICVYTSGKGSSAAGLTAAIIKDPSTRQFHLEGGALVLADGGIVCIDEFDKMRDQDRIAIHEAMEQQTISIAKAGITTILNSRTSILAAANPTFGSYIDFKSKQEQIDLQSTILSRFDCIFTVIDQKDEINDRKLAQHVLQTFLNFQEKERETKIDLSILKKYISYARTKVFPRLNQEAAEALQNMYVEYRSQAQRQKQEGKKHIPITVRQLEAIIRLSESIAKMRLSTVVETKDVDRAKEIFDASTMDALKSDFSLNQSDQDVKKILEIEEKIKLMLQIGQRVQIKQLQDQLEDYFKDDKLIQIAFSNLLKKGDLREQSGSFFKRVE